MNYPDPGFHFDGTGLALFFVAVCFFFGLFGLIDMARSWIHCRRIERGLASLHEEIEANGGVVPSFIMTHKDEE